MFPGPRSIIKFPDSARNRNPEEYKGTVFYRTLVLLAPFYNSGTCCIVISDVTNSYDMFCLAWCFFRGLYCPVCIYIYILGMIIVHELGTRPYPNIILWNWQWVIECYWTQLNGQFQSQWLLRFSHHECGVQTTKTYGNRNQNWQKTAASSSLRHIKLTKQCSH